MKTVVLRGVLSLCVLCFLSWQAQAGALGGPIYPGEQECKVKLPDHIQWMPQEIWAWEERICLGKIADMSDYGYGDGSSCNPKRRQKWGKAREVSSTFLKTILAFEPYKGSLTGNGVQIQCAIFPQVIDLANVTLDKPLRLGRSYFKYNVDLRSLISSNYVSLKGSVVDGYILAQHLDVAGNFDLSGRGQYIDVNLEYAKIGKNLLLSYSTVTGDFRADGSQVTETVFMRKGRYKDVRMVRATIGGQLQIRESEFTGHFNLSNAHISSEFQLSTPYGDEIVHTEKNGEFEPPKWIGDAKLTLRNAYAQSLNDTASSWEMQRGNLDLIGFTYERLGGLRATMNSTMTNRSEEWMADWLGKQKDYDTVINPQPYEQLASVLRNQGFPGKADAVMFESQNYERDHAKTTTIDRIKLNILWATIGYGYYSSVAMIWFVTLTVMGMFVYSRAKKTGAIFCRQSFWYSFDMALPLIELEGNHDHVKPGTWYSSYFYFHKISGFIFVSFLLAGLSGLTK